MSRIDELQEALKKANPEQLQQIEAILGIQSATNERARAITETETETVEVDPSLTRFAEMYNNWSAESKSRLSWKKVQTAMLTNDGALLKQVEAIPNGPIMFGADKSGNILFANGGIAPILTGMTYSAARKAAKDIGLDLFPCVKIYEKSEEELMFEEFTGNPLVIFEDMREPASSWLESGENDDNIGLALVSNFYPADKKSAVGGVMAWCKAYYHGVRGLRRVKA